MAAFSTALDAFNALTQEERADPRVNPECGSRLLHHGHTTERAIVFLHGITSSPCQFLQLGELFHQHNYTVLIPRMPLHGFIDRRTTAPKDLTQRDFVSYANTAVDMARAFAEDNVTLVGLSVSGAIAAHCAQERSDLDLAVLLAPAFAPWSLPVHAVRPISKLVRRLPNINAWWDPLKRDTIGPVCSYPRFSTWAMAEAFGLAAHVYTQAQRHPPNTNKIACVINKQDLAVNNRATRAVIKQWQTHGAHVILHEFTNEVGRLHDFIGPYQPGARPEFVYPFLHELIERSA
ncbi:MAG TPA: alpha/beta hydrolase [Chloroflexota bacterium]